VSSEGKKSVMRLKQNAKPTEREKRTGRENESEEVSFLLFCSGLFI